ncbi:hypothetical protein [Cerasicoccus maritimus]|uniref:hypothetical protein n=1 Tax=Cerasicoccus maritimus TaxID=490089 RepID=UPI002852713D|nr:hypothetical protein [Cerasicoccus maritimus]
MARKKKQKRPPRIRRKKRRIGDEPSGLDMIEESIHLLRQLPMACWTMYLLGAAPFLVAFLYFWNEMSFSGLAAGELLGDSLTLAGLFVWMRFWQAWFARGMWATLRGQELPPVSLQTGLRMLLKQVQWQTTGLLVLPIAALLTFPFARLYGFFQNQLLLSAICDEQADEPITPRAFKLAGVWTNQSWSLIGLLIFLGMLFYLTWLTVIMTIPLLLKTFFGVDGAAIRGSEFITSNSTTVSIALGLMYLVYAPLAQGAYLLRCFYTQSLQSGDDLLFNLRMLKKGTRKLGRIASAAVVMLALGLVLAQPLMAAPNEQGPSETSVEEAIEDTMSQPDYIWRFPKEEVTGEVEPSSWLKDFLERLKQMSDDFSKWLEGLFDDKEPEPSEPWDFDFSGLSILDVLTYLLIAIAVIALIWVAVKLWLSRQPAPAAALNVSAIEQMPDLNREDITADELPRNRWLEIAEELIAKGDYRLALRALFLAELSYLSEEGMIKLARHKSNYDYRRELMRRGDSAGAVLEAYVASANLFDGVWYGERAVGEPEIEHMQGFLRNAGLAW